VRDCDRNAPYRRTRLSARGGNSAVSSAWTATMSENQPTGFEVSEVVLPGIGRRYTLPAADGARAVVVMHHSGRRDLYVFPPRGTGDEPLASVSLTDDQARRLGAVLGGAYFKPEVVADVETVIGGLLIDWVTLRPDSPGVDRSIADLEIRRRTRMTVVAILRDDETILAPVPGEVVRAGDRLVVVGRQEDLGAFLRHVVGPADG
jgi:TrkA domain protein